MKSGLSVLTNRSLYREYKRRLNAREVLAHYGAENCQELVGTDGSTEIVHSCLLDRVEPHHAHGDQNPSASINLDKKVYVCYNYWGGDLFHLIMKMEQKESLSDILPIVGDFLDGSTLSTEDFKDEIEKILAGANSYELDIPEYSTKILVPWAFSHPYIRERGIDVDTSSKLQIGYDETTNRIVFPHFWDDKLVGWQQRAIPADSRWPGTEPPVPKYKNSSGFPKSETLYGVKWLNTSDTVIVVESPMSVARAHTLGLNNVVATFGAKVSHTQIDLLKSFSHVVLWFDADPAGKLAERKVVRYLHKHTSVKVVVSEQNKDLADYETLEDCQVMINAAIPAILVLAEWDREKNGTKKKGR
jgi:5S rRNA maturation endonuclease (ribonuclease M5)